MVMLLLPLGWVAAAGDFGALCRDRAAIERVYHDRRLGDKPPFEEMLPRDTVATLVRLDQHKESVLGKIYGVEVTPAMVQAEVERINATTRAPEVLAELKAALGNDPSRFARSMARPLVVERTLRARFENDDALHAPQRRQAEQVREKLLQHRAPRTHEPVSHPRSPSPQSANYLGQTTTDPDRLVEELAGILKGSQTGSVTEMTWQLGPRLNENMPANSPDELEVEQRFGPNARLLSRPEELNSSNQSHFDDLPGELQRVLRAQLRHAGDISAAIETPHGFLLYLALEKTPEQLRVLSLAVPKRSYEQWLKEQVKDEEGKP